MKLSIPPRPTLIIAIVLLATNVVTGLITAHAVRARDYSNTNLTYLLTWGMISQRFEEARERKLPHVLPKTNAEIYFGYEDTARFVVRHPTAPAPSNPDSDRQVLLGCGCRSIPLRQREYPSRSCSVEGVSRPGSEGPPALLGDSG